MDEFLNKCVTGDDEARNQFVEANKRIIYAAAAKLTGSQNTSIPGQDLDDLVQDVFVRIFKNDSNLLKTFDPGRASLSTWLTIVTRSTVLSRFRKKQIPTVSYEPDLHEGTMDETAEEESKPEFPEGLLSTRQKLIMTMLYEKEMDIAEIAENLGIEAQSVRSAKHKALEKLRKHYGVKD
ncbi:MAG: sigma-70 family RNA polymerase sigma factor [Planctomycetes bacterium]|nr:sigma-70 family RNA polymerase sigma factor [Planctomycetota bacterium]